MEDMWVKQCHVYHPVITIFKGGIFLAFPVMGGKHCIVLPTLIEMYDGFRNTAVFFMVFLNFM